MSVIAAVIEQRVEEATFLWLLRDAAVHEPHCSLSDLAYLDNRVDAHIDGLRIAGDEDREFLIGTSVGGEMTISCPVVLFPRWAGFLE